MSRAIGYTMVVVGMVLPPTGGVEACDHWLTDLDVGKVIAAEHGKDLLINFTGTEWCVPCIELKYDVLDRPGFASVGENFILVELEFPASEEDLPRKLREVYASWKERYGIRVFPTVVLADATGLPYALTGHIGLGPEEYVRHLDKLRGIRERRDAALAKAADTRGIERARHLDEALSALREGLGEQYAERHGDPLVRFYRPQIEQILALAGAVNVALRDKYRVVLEADEERRRIAEIDDRVAAIRRDEGIDAALEFVDRELEGARSTELRNRLRLTRLVFLEWSDRHEEALAFAERLAQDDSYSPEMRRRIRDRVAYNLERLGRIDEAVSIYDDLIAEVAGNRKAMWNYHETKAQLLTGAERLHEALETWEAARQYVEPGTFDWENNEFFRAELMARLGRPAEAAAVLDTAAGLGGLNPLSRAGMLAESALILSKAGYRDEAHERATQAEKILASAEPSRSEMPFVEIIRQKLEVAQRESP